MGGNYAPALRPCAGAFPTTIRLVRFLDRVVDDMKRGEAPGKDGWADELTDEDRAAAKF